MVRVLPLFAAALVATGCVDLGGEPHPGIRGRVLLEPGLQSAGLVFFEQGHVHEGTFKYFDLVDDKGHFGIDLPRGSGGPWGVHIYYTDYFYLPLEVQVAEEYVTPITQAAISMGTVRGGSTWADSGRQPDDESLLKMIRDDVEEDNPTFENLTIRHRGDGTGTFRVDVDIADPDWSPDWSTCYDESGVSAVCLSNQELLGNAATGLGMRLNEPSAPERKNYPNGHYWATVPMEDDVGLESDWWFVTADIGCSNSPVMRVRALAADAEPAE